MHKRNKKDLSPETQVFVSGRRIRTPEAPCGHFVSADGMDVRVIESRSGSGKKRKT